jgi:hypothetical protein
MDSHLELAARLMAEHAITFNGRHYQYRSHRSALLSDVVTHAIAQRAPAAAPAPTPAEVPTHDQRQAMSRLGIVHRDGVYHSGGYSYDRLTDALAYANPEAFP